MSGLFEHLAAFDDSERVAARKAAAVANKRVKDQVGDFLANATSLKDFESRLSLVDDDIKTAVADVVAEYGGDAERVEAAVRRSIAADNCEDCEHCEGKGCPMCSKESKIADSSSEADDDDDDDNYSASCKHCKGKGCHKCKGKEAKSCNCWDGYERVPGTKPCSPGSCRKCDDHRKSSDQGIDEQLAEAPSAVGNTSLENGEVEEKPNFLAAAGLADSNKHEFDEEGRCINCGEHTISVRQGCPVDAPKGSYGLTPRNDVDTNAGWTGEPNNGNYPRMATQFRPRGDDRNPYGEGVGDDDYQDSGRDDPAESWGTNVDSSGHSVVPMRPEHAKHLEMCYRGPGEHYEQRPAEANFAVLDSSGIPVASFNDMGRAVGKGNRPLPVDETGFSAPLSGEFPVSPDPVRPRQPIDIRQAADAPENSGGAVKREKLPKGNADATGAPSPKIDKSKAGDEKGHKKRDIDTEYDNSPVPEWRDKQDVTTGRGDAEKGTSDYTHSSPELTSDTLTQEDLPTGNEDAQSTERNIEQNKTETFPNKGQANPVTASLEGFEVVPSVEEHANALRNDAGYNRGHGSDLIGNVPVYTVLKNGKPVAMFDNNYEPHGVGADSIRPLQDENAQEVVDRSHPHLFSPQTSSVSKRIDALMKRATEMSNRYAAAAHTVKEEKGKFFVIEDGKKAAGPFSSKQEAQSRATELNSKENLEKGSSIDPDKNPIQEILNDFNQDQSAIAEFERKAMTDPSCNCNGNCNGTCQR